MSTKHTAGRLGANNSGKACYCAGIDHSNWNWFLYITIESGEIVCVAHGATKQEAEANAARIVACVNACEGINPEAVPMLVEACREFIRKCDAGEARSLRSYKQMQEALAKAAL